MNNIYLVELLALAIGTGLPLLTALVTRMTNGKLKALLDSLLAATAAGLASLATNPPHGLARWEQAGIALLLALVAAGAAAVPGTPVHQVSAVLSKASPRFGLGRAPRHAVHEEPPTQAAA